MDEVRFCDGPVAGGAMVWPSPIQVGAVIDLPLIIKDFPHGTDTMQRPLGPGGTVMFRYVVEADGAHWTGDVWWTPYEETHTR